MNNPPERSHIILTPVIHIRASRVAEVLGIPLDKASRILAQPDTRDIIQKGLEQSFQETTDNILKSLSRIPLVSNVPCRIDAVVQLPELPAFKSSVG